MLEGGVPRIAREQRPGRGVDAGGYEGCSCAAGGAENPFDICGQRQPFGAARCVPELKARNLYRIGKRHVLKQFRGDSV